MPWIVRRCDVLLLLLPILEFFIPCALTTATDT
jgi:hypothetical protein